MICLRCDNQEFVPKPDAVIEQEFKGETLSVQAPALACSKCGWVTVSLAQADELRRRTTDAYRKKHGLLTSDAIRAFREVLDMTQREFAAFLGVGEASVKRWETWSVQEKSSDQLMRLKCLAALMDKPPAAADFLAQHQFEIDPAGITTQKTAAQESLDVPRWTIKAEVAQQFSFCIPAESCASGLPPPCGDLSAFSLSVPCRGRTLKKKMLTKTPTTN